jgi:hypothetical protein
MIETVSSLISLIGASAAVGGVIGFLIKRITKEFGFLKKTQDLKVKELGLRQTATVAAYPDYITAYNHIAKLLKQTTEYVFINGVSLQGLFSREQSLFMRTLRDLTRRNIPIRILLVNPQSNALKDHESLQVRETLRDITHMKNGGIVEVRLTSRILSFSTVFNESALLFDMYPTAGKPPGTLILVEDKEIVSSFREVLESIWKESESANI